jgi:uncharacterized protein with NRDE domain
LALYFRMVERYPVIVAANRDEHYDRPSAPPSPWSTRPRIFAGKDLLAGGTWLGVNEHGLLVGILNRRPDNAPEPLRPTRSRGLLCLDLLGFKSTAAAYAFINRHEEFYQPFTVVFLDSDNAWVAYNIGRKIETLRLDKGLHVYSSAAEFDAHSEKVDRAHVQFGRVLEELPPDVQETSAWLQSLSAVLGDHTLANGSNDPKEAICVHGPISGTVSSTIIFYDQLKHCFDIFNSAGPPCRNPFGQAFVLNVP